MQNAWQFSWSVTVQPLTKLTGDDMRKTILNYRCDDREGWYISSVEVIKKSDRQFIAHYLDFPNISSISSRRHHLDYWCPAVLRALYAEETGYAPKIHLRDIEYIHEAQNARKR